MKGAIKHIRQAVSVLLLTGVFAASSLASGYVASSEAAKSLLGGTADVQASSDGLKPTVNNVTGVTDASLSSEYINKADGEINGGVTYSDNDVVTVIVRLDDESLLSKATYDAGMDVDDFAATDAGEAYSAYLAGSRNRFIDSYSSRIISVGYSYSTIFNGFSAQIYYKHLAALEKAPGVSSVMIGETYEKPEAITENNVNVYSTGIYDSSEIAYDGSGTVVGILDTGLDYTHSAFQNQPTGNLALTLDDVSGVFDELAAKSLDAANSANVQDLRAEDLYKSDKVPFTYDYADSDADVYPVNDHGTHVAGIIAGKDSVITGVATQAQLAIFKVFSNEDEGAPQEAILAALNDAILLGVDAVNMSLGSSCGFSRATDEDATNDLYDAIKATGISLLVAASNSYSSAQGSENGDTNLTSNPDSATIGSPSTYDAAMSVASISGVKTKYLMADGQKEIYFNEGAKLNGDTKDFVAEMLGDKKEAEFEYVVVPGVGQDSNYASISVAGKIAVVRRGTTTFEDKITTAQRKGAIGVIIYNNVSGTISMSVGKVTVPACSIQMDYGNYLAEQGSGTLKLSTEYLAGPFMSNFSSWGPKAELELSPDITAHGGDIYSAVRGGYDTYSGTSMACPNMAGATILVREYVKENYPQLTNYEKTELTYQLMMSTATIARNEEGNPYSPRKQGAGLADIASAIDTSAYLYVEGQNKTKLSLGDDVNKTGVYTMTFNLKNLSAYAVSYKIDPVVMTETVSSDGKTVAEKAHMFDDFSSAVSVENGTLKGNVVTVTGYGDCRITVKVSLSAADKAYLDANFANGMYVEGFIRLESMNTDGIDLNIPYLAFYGDWTQAPLLDVTAFEVGASQEDPSVLEDDKLKADVYATAPMGGFRYSTGSGEYEETFYYLGGFGYRLADGYEMPAIIEDKAAISNDIDATYSLYSIAAGLLRNAKYAEMQIVDSLTGEVVFSKVSENNRKSYSNGGSQTGGYVDVGFYVNEYNLENNRKYTYSMVCYLDFDEHEQNNLKNTFSFSFYIDNEAPTLVEENTRIRTTTNSSGKITSKSLNMYVYDNHYIQGYFIYTYSDIAADGTFNDQEFLVDGCIPVDGERNETTSIVLDITDRYADIMEKGGKLMVQIYDYAKNSSTYTIDLNGIEKEVTDIQIKNNRDSYTLRINRQEDLNSFIDVYPQNTLLEALVWTSSDESVVTVRDGVATGVSAGEAVITVADKTGKVSRQITITVPEAGGSTEITLSSLELKTNAVTLERGETYVLTVELKPYNLTEDITLSWTGVSSYFSYEVDANDQTRVTITALKSGSGTLTVRANGKTISASCRITVEEEFETEGHYLRSYTGRGDENGVVEIPDDLGITHIYQYAFINNPYITKIIFPDGVEEIGEAAVYGCDNLVEVVLPSTMKLIDRFGMAWNPKLEKVNLENVGTIGDLALYNSPALKSVDLSGTMLLGERAFGMCTALTSVDLSNVVSVGAYAFAGDRGLKEVITGKETRIGHYAFASCTGLVSLEINSPSVGTAAFSGCSALRTVIFGNAVDTIGYGAFSYCEKLQNVYFRSTVRVIDTAAFAGCSALTAITLPAGLEELGDNAFGDCSALSSVTISADAKLTTIGVSPFVGASLLSSFKIESGAKYLTVQNGILYDKGVKTVKLVPYGYTANITLPSGVSVVGEHSFNQLSGVKSIDLNNAERIEAGAFYRCGTSEITFGSKLVYIGDRAFYGSAITSLPVYSGVEYIGEEAFTGCTDLTTGTLVLPDSLAYVGAMAFSNTAGITKVVFNDTLETVSDYMFYNSAQLTGVDFGGVTAIGGYAFAGTPIARIVVPAQVTSLGEGVFANCGKLVSATISAEIGSIPAGAFYGCASLTDVSFPDSVAVIGESAFRGCAALTSFDFGSVRAVGVSAFADTALTAVSSDSLQIVGSAAFAGLSTLTTVDLSAATELYSYAFYQCPALTSAGLNIPAVKTIGAYAFAGTGLERFSSETVGVVEAYAFADTPLTQADMPNLTTLGSHAFLNTSIATFAVGSGLLPQNTDVTASDGLSVTAFKGAHELTAILVAENNPEFVSYDGVLYRSLSVDDGTVVIGYLELVSYPENKTGAAYTVRNDTLRIAAYAFYDAAGLEEVTLPVTLKAIGASAFEGCLALKKVTFLSAQAPALEGEYDAETGVSYRNFVTGIDEASACALTAVVPSNAVGYGTHVWTSYFAEFVSSTVVAPTENTLYLISLIDSLPAVVTAENADTIELCRILYDSSPEAQKAYVTNVAKLEAAEKQLADLGVTVSNAAAADKELTDGEAGASAEEKGGCCGAISPATIAAVLAAGMILVFAVGSKRTTK